MKKIIGFIIATFSLLSCDKGDTVNNEPLPQTRADVQFIDFVSGEVLPTMPVCLGKGVAENSSIDWPANEKRVTDENGKIEISFDPAKDIRFMKPIKDAFHPLAYELFKHGGSYPFGGGWKYDAQLAIFRGLDGSLYHFQVPVFRKAETKIRVKSVAGINTNGLATPYLTLQARGYNQNDTTDAGVVAKIRILYLPIENNQRIDTTITVDLFGEMYNQLSWELVDLFDLWGGGNGSIQKIETGANNEITFSF